MRKNLKTESKILTKALHAARGDTKGIVYRLEDGILRFAISDPDQIGALEVSCLLEEADDLLLWVASLCKGPPPIKLLRWPSDRYFWTPEAWALSSVDNPRGAAAVIRYFMVEVLRPAEVSC